MNLPIKVEGIMYAVKDGKFSFLLLKRSPEDGEFWQPLTGTVEDGEKLRDCLLRELKEETGIQEVLNVTPELHRFNWKNKRDETITEMVYGIELKPNQEVSLSLEHTEHCWCDFDEAINLLAKENNKKAFLEFRKRNSF